MKLLLYILIFLQLIIINAFSSNKSLLFYGNCTACHMEYNKKSAPTFFEIRENYKRAYPIKKDFIKAMSSWVVEPNEDTSIMLNDVKKYKLMPNLSFDLKTIEEISEYIYYTDFIK